MKTAEEWMWEKGKTLSSVVLPSSTDTTRTVSILDEDDIKQIQLDARQELLDQISCLRQRVNERDILLLEIAEVLLPDDGEETIPALGKWLEKNKNEKNNCG